jgi:CBS domain-containing protein
LPGVNKGAIMASSLVDARPIHGDPGLPEVAKVFGDFRRHPATMGLLLTESLSHRPKNRSMRDILRGKGDTFNVKTSGLLPVVNIARWAALGVGSTELQTAQRLRAAAGSQILPTRQADRLIEVFELFQRLACAISSTRSRTESRPLTSSTVTSSHRSSAA